MSLQREGTNDIQPTNDRSANMNGEAGKPDSTQLALDRTWLAHERTLMAWVRTATSMITFGFTIYKFFQFEAAGKSGSHGLLTPRQFAMTMIGIGLVALLFATISHRREVKPLTTHLERRHHSLAELVAWMIATFGILALLAAMFHS